jgi:RNA polymerase sigma factor (TIGR02999 family)
LEICCSFQTRSEAIQPRSQEEETARAINGSARRACLLEGGVTVSEVTEIMHAIEAGDPSAADRLLPLVYDELRQLAATHLAKEKPGQTLQPTALVHEAYLRLVGGANPEQWNSRGHFFAAAAVAIRRILIDNARRKRSLKRGGQFVRQELDELPLALPEPREDVLALDEALRKLEVADPQAAKLVQLLYFAGLTLPEAARTLGVSPRTAGSLWAYARAWLRREIEAADASGVNS